MWSRVGAGFLRTKKSKTLQLYVWRSAVTMAYLSELSDRKLVEKLFVSVVKEIRSHVDLLRAKSRGWQMRPGPDLSPYFLRPDEVCHLILFVPPFWLTLCVCFDFNLCPKKICHLLLFVPRRSGCHLIFITPDTANFWTNCLLLKFGSIGHRYRRTSDLDLKIKSILRWPSLQERRGK